MLRSGAMFTRLVYLLVAAAVAGACSGGGDFTVLTADDPVAEIPEGLSLSANPAALAPDFGVQLSALSTEALGAGQAGDAWAGALAAVPAHLHLQSPLFDIQTSGEPPAQLFLSVVVPSEANPAVLELYAWDGEIWSFVPAQARGGQLVASVSAAPQGLALFEAAALPPLVYTTLEPGQALSGNLAASINAVLIGGVLAQADGSLTGQVPGVALEQAFAVYPTVRNYTSQGVGEGTLAGILRDETARANHLKTLLSWVISAGYDGLMLDYRVVSAELGPAYTTFVEELAGGLHGQGKALFVQVETPEHSGEAFTTGGYDWRGLGAAADALLVPVWGDPAAFGDGSVDALLAWAVGQVSRSRLRLVISGLSVESAGGRFTLLDPASALAPFGSVMLAPEAQGAPVTGQPVTLTLSGPVRALDYDPQAFAARYRYSDDAGAVHTVWLTSPDTLRQRLALAEKYRLGGVLVSGLAGAPAGLLDAITQYRVNMEAAAQHPARAGVLWTVSDASGILAQATAQPGQPYVHIAQAPGDYQVSAGLHSGGSKDVMLDFGSAALHVVPTTPTPAAGPAATEAPKAAGSGSTSGGAGSSTSSGSTSAGGNTGGGVFVPPPPISGGPFELGGQVPGFMAHPTLMQQAGMKWVKTQALGDMGGFIASGHAAGFKVLVSALGDRSRATDSGYWPEYAAWVAGMAAQGADAIEIWNEANIDREWPTGQISGATYTEMLKQAYNAVKAANGGTLVIGGAPAPTGAEGAFPGRVVNDDNFLRQMANAGAANYMDCMGIHYNTGTTSPHATTGSALSGYHYSFYFWPMVDLYYNTFGGSRPLCFTELGYLTPEGYGSLPPAFGWAANTTVAQQAQWLAESASLAGGSGKVRLMIIFNVDFTLWGADPQAGYAILRPDGTCPACAALDAVMP